MPEWVRALCETLFSTIELDGILYLEGRHLAPDDNEWGVDLLEVAPSLREIVEAGPNDGEEVYGIIRNFDLLAAQELFDEVHALAFGLENEGRPIITLRGLVEGQEIVVLVNGYPFDDADASATIE